MKCWRCDGKGSVLVETKTGVGYIIRTCPVCHGKGEEKFSNQDVLVLTDMQNGFRNGFTEPLFMALPQFLGEYQFSKVLATKFVNYPESKFFKELGYTHLSTKESQELIPGIRPFLSAVYLKDSYGCVDTGFLGQVRLLNEGVMPNHVLLAGIDTEGSVLAMATGLFDAGIKPIVLADYVASSQGTDTHLSALRIIESLFGMGSLLRLG